MILVFGSSGENAGLVIPALVSKGASVRAFAHSAAGAATAKGRGAQEAVVGDLADAASVRAALRGIEGVFYLAPAFLPDEAEVGKRVVAACVAAGVRRFVFSSVIHPVIASLSNHAAKAPVEEAVLDSGLDYAFLHPALFFQNYAAGWPRLVETGTLAEPWSNDTRFSRVDYRDVAEVAAIALLEDRLLHGTFELCSEGHLDRHDVAAIIGRVLGRAIEPIRLDPGQLGDEAKPMRPMFDHYDRAGLLGNALTLRAILGREPRSLEAFFRELANR